VFQDEFAETDDSIKQGKTRAWYKVRLKNGIIGYAPREYLDQSAPGCG